MTLAGLVTKMDKEATALPHATTFVDWDEDDPKKPYNWPLRKKIGVTLASGTFVFVVSFSSSAFAPARAAAASQFHTSEVVMSLPVSLFITGYALGPLIWAPISEVIGHASLLVIGLVGCGLFQIPFALAPNTAALLISRFLQGALGSAILTVGTGMFAEVYSHVPRGIAVSSSACFMNCASALSPVVASWLVADLNWRWIGWVTLMLAAVVGAAGPFIIHETSPKIILLRKSRRLRKETGNQDLVTKYSDDKVDFHRLLNKYLFVPIKMLFREPVLLALTVYLTFVWGTLYLSYQMFPIAFQQRGWSPPTANLPFLAVALGIVAAWASFSLFLVTWYKTRVMRGGITPEDRLPPMICGSLILPVAILWFGWSGDVHWVSQVFACFFIGMSLQLIFMTGVVYIVDVYGPNSNCAMSIQVAFRSIGAASFPLWSPAMYRSLGVAWSSTLLAGVAALMLPFPVLFMRYGNRIRATSKYAVSVAG